MNHVEQANKDVLTIFSKMFVGLKLVLECESFVEGDKGRDEFEVDGLLVAANAVIIVEAKRSLREEHVHQVLQTANNVTKYWEAVKLRARDADWPRIEECEIIQVLVAPYASPQVMASVTERKEKFVVITDSGETFRVTYTSPELNNLGST